MKEINRHGYIGYIYNEKTILEMFQRYGEVYNNIYFELELDYEDVYYESEQPKPIMVWYGEPK